MKNANNNLSYSLSCTTHELQAGQNTKQWDWGILNFTKISGI